MKLKLKIPEKWNSKHKGDKTVGLFLSEFLKLGATVSLPFGDNSKYDMIVEGKDKLYKIQMKTGYLDEGIIKGHADSSGNYHVIKYSEEDVDYYAIYCPQNEKLYLVPFEDMSNSIIWLRVDDPKVNNKNIRWARDYEFDKMIE